MRVLGIPLKVDFIKSKLKSLVAGNKDLSLSDRTLIKEWSVQLVAAELEEWKLKCTTVPGFNGNGWIGVPGSQIYGKSHMFQYDNSEIGLMATKNDQNCNATTKGMTNEC